MPDRIYVHDLNPRHEFFVEWDNYSISISVSARAQYKVLETRVTCEEVVLLTGSFPSGSSKQAFRIVFQHLVERV